MKILTMRFFKFATFTILVATLVTIFAVTLTTHAATSHDVTGNARPAGQSNITRGKLGTYFYSPKKLSCTRVSGSCSISIKNGTKVSQSVTANGAVVYTLAPLQVQPISYTTAGTYVYSLSSSSGATLTVTVV